VGGSQSGEDRLHHTERLPRRQRAILSENLAQRPPFDVLHREVDQALIGALVEHRNHVGVGQPGGRLCFADEPVYELRVLGQPRVHDLECHRPVEPGVDGVVDGRHAAARDPPLDVIAAVDGPSDQRVGDGRVHDKGVYGRPAAGLRISPESGG
jgi:hypothetical protein